jgi:hypothetical protein
MTTSVIVMASVPLNNNLTICSGLVRLYHFNVTYMRLTIDSEAIAQLSALTEKASAGEK